VRFSIQAQQATGYEVDIIFANQIDERSSTSHNLLEPKSGLVMAITFEILALYRNLLDFCIARISIRRRNVKNCRLVMEPAFSRQHSTL
jgi:hypothetical protein